MTAAVSARERVRRYGSGETALDALRDVSLEVEPGMLTTVTRPADPDKSTMLKQDDTAAGGTHNAEQILLNAGSNDQASESVLVESPTRTVFDPAFHAAVANVVRTVFGLAQVGRVRSPLVRANAGQISSDRHSALVQFEIRGDQDKADKEGQERGVEVGPC